MKDDFETALELAPNDPALRRVYADWLEDHGRPVRARQQREIADELSLNLRERRPRKGKEENDATANNAVYRKTKKMLFAGCGYCPWHGGENRSRQPGHTSWKKSRKRRWRAK